MRRLDGAMCIAPLKRHYTGVRYGGRSEKAIGDL
jgi:hypothetical protein